MVFGTCMRKRKEQDHLQPAGTYPRRRDERGETALLHEHQ